MVNGIGIGGFSSWDTANWHVCVQKKKTGNYFIHDTEQSGKINCNIYFIQLRIKDNVKVRVRGK